MDLARYYGGLDLLDLHRGRLSWRRLRVLIDHLPPESATKTAMRLAAEADGVPEKSDAEPADAPWSQTEMLLAVVIDRLGDLTYVLQRAHGGKPEKPKPLPRPGVRRKKKKIRPLNAVEAEWLFRHINGLNQQAA